jgi:NitT/TauT family transport system ATP-binding protein
MGRIKVDKVSHSYGAVSVLHNISLEVNPGEIVMLVGPSGCGKTTILNLLSGYVQPLSGSVKKEGVTRTIYQQDGLFPWLTVSENIFMGLRAIESEEVRNKELTDLIKLVRMEGFESHYPHQLSGGMRQRVELARVLAGDSDILLMDEPFSALDYQTRLQMRSELVRMLRQRPRTIIFVTHDIEEAAQLADRVLVLSKRPATICRELIVGGTRPRQVTDPQVTQTMETILRELGLNALSENPTQG